MSVTSRRARAVGIREWVAPAVLGAIFIATAAFIYAKTSTFTFNYDEWDLSPKGS